MVLIAVVAVAATVFTGGAILAALPTVGSLGVGTAMAIGATAGAAGALAGQVAGSVMGVSSFSWRGVAAGAITGAITGGLVEGFGAVGEGLSAGMQGAGKTAAFAVGNAGANYAGQKIAGIDAGFSWRSIAASAVTSMVTTKIAPKISANFESDIAKDFTVGAIGGIVSVHSRRALGMGGDIDYATVAADAFGNALGSALGNAGVRGIGTWQAKRAAEGDAARSGFPSLLDPDYKPDWLYADIGSYTDGSSFLNRYPDATASFANSDVRSSGTISSSLLSQGNVALADRMSREQRIARVNVWYDSQPHGGGTPIDNLIGDADLKALEAGLSGTYDPTVKTFGAIEVSAHREMIGLRTTQGERGPWSYSTHIANVRSWVSLADTAVGAMHNATKTWPGAYGFKFEWAMPAGYAEYFVNSGGKPPPFLQGATVNSYSVGKTTEFISQADAVFDMEKAGARLAPFSRFLNATAFGLELAFMDRTDLLNWGHLTVGGAVASSALVVAPPVALAAGVIWGVSDFFVSDFEHNGETGWRAVWNWEMDNQVKYRSKVAEDLNMTPEDYWIMEKRLGGQ